MTYDYRLTFADEAQWWAEADAHGWVQYEYEPLPPDVGPENPPAPVVKSKIIYYPGIDFVVIGTLYEPAPDPLPDPYTPVPLPGYGVNIRFNPWCDQVDLADDMVQFITTPADPQYTFAGGWFPGPKTPAA